MITFIISVCCFFAGYYTKKALDYMTDIDEFDDEPHEY